MKAVKKHIVLIVHVLVLLTILVNLFRFISPISDKYIKGDYYARFPSLQRAYKNSVYANKKGPFIPDEALYAYASGELAKGGSPVLVNPETPPLGKYLTALSIIYFHNENIPIIVSAVAVLILLYLLGRQVFLSSLTALVTPLLMSFEPLFLNQLKYTPLFDIIQLVFLLLVFYLFNTFLTTKKLLPCVILIQLFVGCFIATKFFATGAPLIIAMGVILLIHREWKRLVYFLLSLPIAIVVLLSLYVKLLLNGYSFRNFIGVQKWIYEYNKGHLELPFTVWPLLLFNKWYVWFGNKRILSDSQWLIRWPISTLASCMTIVCYVFRRIRWKREIEVIMAWIISYLLLLSISNTSVRYFVILIPCLYIVATFGIENIVYTYILQKKLPHEGRN